MKHISTYAMLPLFRWLFISDYNATTAKIFRLSMDGSMYKVLLGRPFLEFPNGLAYDYSTQTLYWIDSGKDIIGSMNIDGSQVRSVVDLTSHFTTSHGFAFALYNGNFYFSDWRADSIRAIYSPNTRLESSAELLSYDRDPTTLRVLDLSQQPERVGGSEH